MGFAPYVAKKRRACLPAPSIGFAQKGELQAWTSPRGVGTRYRCPPYLLMGQEGKRLFSGSGLPS